jgi:hypothetical protein
MEQIIDIIAFTTLNLLFGEDNDTTGGSDNETDGLLTDQSCMPAATSTGRLESGLGSGTNF